MFFKKPTQLSAPQLARQLRHTVEKALAEDPKKVEFLAHVLQCPVSVIWQSPKLQHILDRIESLFLRWCDANTPLEEVQSAALRLAKVHHEANVPPSWLFQVMVAVQDQARMLQAPDCFFAASNHFTQTVLAGQEQNVQALLQSKERLTQALLESSGAGFFLCDVRDGTIVLTNRIFADMLGMPEEDILGQTWQSLTPSDTLAEELSMLDRLRANEFARYEKAFLRKDGSNVPVLVQYRSKPVPYDSREVLVVAVTDLSEIKAKEQALKEEEAYWQEIFNTLAEGVCVFGLDGELYDMNDAYCNLTGYTRAELFQKGWLELTAPEYRHEDQKRLPDIMAGKIIRFEKAYLHKDGHVVPIFISYRLLKRRLGWDKDRLVGTCVDLTDIKAKEQALEEEKKKSEELRAFWETLFNEAPVGMVVYDVDGHYHQVNPKFCEMTGLAKAELLSPHFDYKTILAEKLDATLAQVKNALETGKPQSGELVITSQGKRLEVLCTTVRLPLKDDQGRNLLASWHQDITELKAKEREMQALVAYSQQCLEHLAQAELVHDKTSKEGAAQMIQMTYNQCVEDLQELIHRIANTADTLLASAEELARSQEDLSRRANREAANLEEISANLEEIASAVSENAKHADETKDLAQDVRGQLSQSTSIIDEVTGVIQKATKGAQETTQIAKAIQDIAFTTNILSLNASVEAARAGQHGKGFAVIAAEIRRLAQQVSEESKRSEAIIATLLTAMAAGESGMRQITETVHAIEAKALDMSEHVVAIAEATKEQDDGLQQIAQGVNDLEEGLAQNAAMAEEIQATSESLKRHTEDLTAIVQTFHMDDGQASAAPQTTDLTRALRQAIASHHQWRKRLLEAIYQGKAIDPKTAGDAHACGLGKLLEHNPDLKRLPDYPRIQALHEAFHDEARRIAQLIQAGHKKEARQALMGESVYNTRSQELIEALEDARSVLDSHLNPRASQRLAVITNQPKDDWEVF